MASERAKQAEPVDAGPWIADGSDDGKQAWVDSRDFTHDVRLNISGDFEDDKQKFAYAEALARKLNAAPPADEAVRLLRDLRDNPEIQRTSSWQTIEAYLARVGK